MTPEGIRAVNALASSEPLVALVKLTHPAWADAVRLVQAPVAVTHAGEVYEPAPFDLTLPGQVEGDQPALEWTIGNAGQTLIDRLDLPGNSDPAEVRVRWVLLPRPEVVEHEARRLYLTGAEVQRETVSGAFSPNPVEENAHGRHRMDLAMFPGLS